MVRRTAAFSFLCGQRRYYIEVAAEVAASPQLAMAVYAYISSRTYSKLSLEAEILGGGGYRCQRVMSRTWTNEEPHAARKSQFGHPWFSI